MRENKGIVKFARGSGHVELRPLENRPLPDHQVRIEVRATGICGSDLHVFHDTINYNIRTPVVMGHEFSGVIVEKEPLWAIIFPWGIASRESLLKHRYMRTL